MGTSAADPTLTARYVPRRIAPSLAIAVAFAAVGVVAAAAGVFMGWVLAAFMAWSAANLTRRILRRTPVLTLDAAGVHDHRVPASMAWEDVESMRTVDRRVVAVTVPLLELVPAGRVARDRRTAIAAVLRGDLAFADARDDRRLVVDLRQLDATPEQVLAAARRLRSA